MERRYMKCPTCSDINLVMTERQGVEIDYCPECRGVWLDRGELDKIIERSSPAMPTQNYPESQGKYKHDDHHNSHDDYKYGKKPGVKSFLKDIFD
jgi:Zn-finger nucleic acid-binding protein